MPRGHVNGLFAFVQPTAEKVDEILQTYTSEAVGHIDSHNSIKMILNHLRKTG